MWKDVLLVRRWGMVAGIMAGFWLSLGGLSLVGQSAPPTPGQQDNPFPTEPVKDPAKEPKPNPAKVPAKAGQGQQPSATGQSAPEQAKPAGGNEFPGENSDAPIIPLDPGPADRDSKTQSGAEGNGGASRSSTGDGDPVRSPDGVGNDDGFSSSDAGLSPAIAEDDSAAPSKATKSKSRKQEIKEDVNVGGFYLEKKNWKAAFDRFSTAFALDGENPDAVWGLAEAERHLMLLDKAKEHYELFLSYDPKGPHGKSARKALEQVEQARAGSAGAAGTPSSSPH